MELVFTKMHGCGNDFVVLDGRKQDLRITSEHARFLADRHFGVGCDQVLVLTESPTSEADIALAIYNSDGSASGACGNGSRCVADLLMEESKATRLRMATSSGVIEAWREGEMIAVDMGEPRFEWQDIPLTHEADTLGVDLGAKELPPAVMVNMGNPHAVHAVEDAEAIDLERIGSALEHHPIFPQGSNIEVISLAGENILRMRVWERGVGVTIACGSGACAAVVAARRLELIEPSAEVIVDGGRLFVEWRKDNHVIMRGTSSFVFSGKVSIPESLSNREAS